jgi:hypothetical protein
MSELRKKVKKNNSVMVCLSCGKDQISVNTELVPHWLFSLPPQSRSDIQPDPHNLA